MQRRLRDGQRQRFLSQRASDLRGYSGIPCSCLPLLRRLVVSFVAMKYAAVFLASLLCAGCSRNLSRTEAAKQIMDSTPVRMGASAKVGHIGSVVKLTIMEVFTDGPRARVQFAYEIKLDKPEYATLFKSKDATVLDLKDDQDVWVGTDQANFFNEVPSGNFENFGAADFEKMDDGWMMRKINMDATN